MKFIKVFELYEVFSHNFLKDINLLFLSLSQSLSLDVLTYPLVLGIFKTNGFLTLPKLPIKYLEYVFFN